MRKDLNSVTFMKNYNDFPPVSRKTLYPKIFLLQLLYSVDVLPLHLHIYIVALKLSISSCCF